MTEVTKVNRPVYRNISIPQILFAYRLPPAGILSILHRVSGALLFLALPFLLWLFEKSLTSEMSFKIFTDVTGHWYVKLVLLALSWGYLHHFCAGIRHLLMDTHMGLEKAQARTSALIVFAVSIVLTLAVAAKLFGVF